MSAYSGIIGVVGNCAAGKTTLVEGLKSRGYQAVNIAQEHSAAPRLWQRKNPELLIYLSCTIETARKRRQISWGQERLDEQWERLKDAREHSDLILPTDDKSIEQVLEAAITFIEQT